MINKVYPFKYKAHYTSNYLSVWINPNSFTYSYMFINDNRAIYSSLGFIYKPNVRGTVVQFYLDGTKSLSTDAHSFIYGLY